MQGAVLLVVQQAELQGTQRGWQQGENGTSLKAQPTPLLTRPRLAIIGKICCSDVEAAQKAALASAKPPRAHPAKFATIGALPGVQRGTQPCEPPGDVPRGHHATQHQPEDVWQSGWAAGSPRGPAPSPSPSSKSKVQFQGLKPNHEDTPRALRSFPNTELSKAPEADVLVRVLLFLPREKEPQDSPAALFLCQESQPRWHWDGDTRELCPTAATSPKPRVSPQNRGSHPAPTPLGTHCLHQSRSCWHPPPPPRGAAAAAGQGAAGRRGAGLASPPGLRAQNIPHHAPPWGLHGLALGVLAVGSL